MSLAIWWIRRDLRLVDNPALKAALDGHDMVLPVFILDPALLKRPAPKRQAFLLAGLRKLDEDLQRRGSGLVIRSGSPLEVLEKLVAESSAQAIYAAEDYSPYARARDDKVSARFFLNRVLDVTIHHPIVIRRADGRPYTVYSAFRKAWLNLPLPDHTFWSPPDVLPAAFSGSKGRLAAPAASSGGGTSFRGRLAASALPGLPSDPLPEADPPPDFPPGEEEARLRLARFLNGPVFDYEKHRGRLDLDGTSALSPYFHFGMLSALQAYWAVREANESALDEASRRGCVSWVNELIWREFYNTILYYFPEVLKTAFNPALREVAWRDPAGPASADLRAWQEGRTGYPVVDACMRQLAQTGWMHNRGRMIVASFLTRDLLLNWQEGESWFMRQLVDGDVAANNGGWQWAAGVGASAAPYFRIFNPVLQGKKFDPHGDFVRRWLPELAGLPEKLIYEPWLAPQRIPGYPSPSIYHAAARERALSAYQKAIRNRSSIDQLRIGGSDPPPG